MNEIEGTWTFDWLIGRLRQLTEGGVSMTDMRDQLQKILYLLEERQDDGRIDELDEGIAPVVRLLRQHGINTFASCQGGCGHSFASPTVRMWPINLGGVMIEMETIAGVLSAAGYRGYYLKVINSYQTLPHPWLPKENSFIELEFWGDWQSLKCEEEPLRTITLIDKEERP